LAWRALYVEYTSATLARDESSGLSGGKVEASQFRDFRL
jgi:hypothetical protein